MSLLESSADIAKVSSSWQPALSAERATEGQDRLPRLEPRPALKTRGRRHPSEGRGWGKGFGVGTCQSYLENVSGRTRDHSQLCVCKSATRVKRNAQSRNPLETRHYGGTALIQYEGGTKVDASASLCLHERCVPTLVISTAPQLHLKENNTNRISVVVS